MGIDILFSNRMEALFDELSQALFANSHPFSRRMVIVPGGGMKGWVLRRLAEHPDFQIAAGLQVGFIEPSLDLLCSTYNASNQNQEEYQPNRLELALGIEQELQQLLTKNLSLPLELQQVWAPVLDYAKSSNPEKKQKRICSLAAALAPLFDEYGKYGGKMVASWSSSLQHWQALLWQKLAERFHIWHTPYRKFHLFIPDKELTSEDLQVHLFGLSYIPPLYHQFLLKLAERCAVRYYLLSPCLRFWSDLLSRKESSSLQKRLKQNQAPLKQREALSDFLSEHHPLLANLGRVGREMALQIEESSLPTREKYFLSGAALQYPVYSEWIDEKIEDEASRSPLTILQGVQADMLLMRTPSTNSPVALPQFDGSIQVHASATRNREVQAVYNTIMAILEAHQNDPEPIRLEDIVVMAPNLAESIPHIQNVFGSEESCLSFQIMQPQVPAHNPLIKAYLHLLCLASSRWEASAVLRLLEFPAFLTRQQIKGEEAASICRWIEQAGIEWGRDAEQRHALLQRASCCNGLQGEASYGSWKHGFNGLLQQCTTLSFDGTEGLETSQSRLLGRWMQLFYSLQEDLKPLLDGTQLTLGAWMHYLRSLYHAYLQPGTQEEKEGESLLQQTFTAFARAERRLQEAQFAFPSIFRHFEAALHKEEMHYRETSLEAVRFCSLLSMRGVPAQVIILMGMEADAFPGKEEVLSLNLLHKSSEADYCPCRGDFDRYLFLEALLSARRYFILNYVVPREREAKGRGYSFPVHELLTYLDRAFTVPEGKLSELCHIEHPKHPFHPRYFENSDLKSYCISHYRAHLATLSEKRKHSFLRQFPRGPISTAKQSRIDLAELLSFARSPIKYSLAALGMHFPPEEDLSEGPLSISFLNSFMLAKQGVTDDAQKLLAEAEKRGVLPQGPFKSLDREKICAGISDYKEALKNCGVLEDSWKQLRFNEASLPLCFSFDQQPFYLCGQIDLISSDGLVLLEKDVLAKAVAKWPLILAYAALIERHELPLPKKVIFAGSKCKVREIAFAQPLEKLERYLRYYFEAKTSLSPLMPAWIELILMGSAEQLLQKWAQENEQDGFEQQYDEAVKWLMRSSPEIDAASVLENWQGCCRELYGEMAAAWYDVGAKK